MTFTDEADTKVSPSIIEIAHGKLIFRDLEFKKEDHRKIAIEAAQRFVSQVNFELDKIGVDREIPLPIDLVKERNLSIVPGMGISFEATNIHFVIEELSDGSIKVNLPLVLSAVFVVYQGIAAYSSFKTSINELLQDTKAVYVFVVDEIEESGFFKSTSEDKDSEPVPYPKLEAVFYSRREEDILEDAIRAKIAAG
ncbi:hypothetical protein [Ruegeria arenilitoris]|uniref:hypothetical protein n=1 Tax=Ruegeria arenilitoris TaxID=1173585 RepID=UPI00147FC09A|nr:hypothetical protein [Ruegeria arenilitoris]